jgi:2-methylisocitrate lyase-like PEP mutase family enzyme
MCKSIDRPFNIVRGPRKEMLTVEQVGALGVKRISTGGMMHAVAMSAMIGAAKEMGATGTWEFTKSMPFAGEIDALLTKGAAG